MVKVPVTNSPMVAWIRVIRPLNLSIIAIAIIILRFSSDYNLQPINWAYEALFTLPLVLLAAGGNILNDYFDIKEDRINKPERALVGRVLKRRIALASHWALTAIGIILAAVLSLKIENSTPVVIAFLISIVLFFYSAKLKGRVLIGNFAVAASLSSVIPFAYADEIDTSFSFTSNLLMFLWEFGILMSVTFLIAFTRELTKDIEDIKGDEKAGHLTFPIVYSINASWRVISVLVLAIIGITVWIHTGRELDVSLSIFSVITIIITYFTWQKKATQLSAWLKLLLAAGLLLCYF